MRRSFFLSAVLLLAGCPTTAANDTGPTPGDAGNDANNTPTVDGGHDGGPVVTDGGQDAGPMTVDANVDANVDAFSPAMMCATSFAGCTEATTTSPTGAVTISAAGAPGSYHYDTPCIRIHTGTMVTITNSTTHPLQAASCSPSDSPIAAAPSGTTFTFDHVGRYGYYCSVHGSDTGTGMAGLIIVE